MAPKVSVLISTYNRPLLLAKALDSVFAQTFQDFEVVVIDDGLEQRADKVAGTYDERVRYIANDTSRGCAGSRNVGIKSAQGEYVAFLDDDDVWQPVKLEKQIGALEKNPKAAFSFTGAEEHFDDRIGRTVVPEGLGDYHEYALRRFGGLLSSTLVIRRDVFKEAGLFSEEFPTHTDIDVMIRVTEKYKGIGVNEPLVVRLLKSSHTQMGTDLSRRIRGRLMLFKKYQKKFEERPEVYAKHLARLGEFYRDSGNSSDARDVFRRAWKQSFRLKYFLHYCSMMYGGLGYRLYKKIKG